MKVLNFGSLNIDYVYSVDSFVRPGETLAPQNVARFCGGKGLNQSIAIAKCGAPVSHAGKVGFTGMILVDKLRENGVEVSGVQVVDGIGGHAIIQVDSRGQNCILCYGGTNKQIERAHIDEVLSRFTAGDMLLLQNEINEIGYLIDAAYDRRMVVAFNPSPMEESVSLLPLSKVTYFLLNEVEGEQLSGEREPMAMAYALKSKYPQSRIVLTLGAEGALYYDGDKLLRQSCYKSAVVDTTAAGDTFAGYLLGAMAQGEPPERALDLASRAASIAVSRKGAADSIPTRAEVLAHSF